MSRNTSSSSSGTRLPWRETMWRRCAPSGTGTPLISMRYCWLRRPGRTTPGEESVGVLPLFHFLCVTFSFKSANLFSMCQQRGSKANAKQTSLVCPEVLEKGRPRWDPLQSRRVLYYQGSSAGRGSNLHTRQCHHTKLSLEYAQKYLKKAALGGILCSLGECSTTSW